MPKEMKRIDGHVCQPLVEWIRRESDEMAKGWGGKERCLPFQGDQVELMRSQILKIQRHIRRRVLENMKRSDKQIKAEWATESWEDEIEEMIQGERWSQL